jgi:hypothetical protein
MTAKSHLSHHQDAQHIQPLQLGLWPLIQQIRHFEARPVWVETWCGPLTVPGPFFLELRLQLVFEHLHDVLAENGEELVAVERAACCDVETLCTGMRGDDEVG